MTWVDRRWKGPSLGPIPLALLGFAVLLVLLCLNLPWFGVTTRIQAWEYDPSDAEGKGTYTGYSVLVTTNMRPLSLETKIDPKDIQRVLENNGDLPSYDNEMDGTGSAMMGVFLFSIVAFFALVAAAGTYALHLRGARDLRRGVWRFAGLFAAFSVFALLYLALAVPAAAETDTREVLHSYASTLEGQNLPRIDPQMLNPNVSFYNTWVCCPPKSHFERNGEQFLVVVTTTSRPAAAFWLTTVDIVLVGGGFALAHFTGQLDAKGRLTPTGPAPMPAKAA